MNASRNGICMRTEFVQEVERETHVSILHCLVLDCISLIQLVHIKLISHSSNQQH